MFSISHASAQSTNAAPDTAKTDTPFDPAKTPNLPEPAKKAFAQASAQMKAGEIAGFVFAASPDAKVWALKAAPKAMADFNLADLARTTLESCEASLGEPCAILSVNGFDTRLKAGGWAKQPVMLFRRASDFDSSLVPFVAAPARAQIAAYEKATGPRAFALTSNGGWLWRGGASIGQAIDKTLADCATQYKDSPCILYAVNNRVVFGSR
jgi:hypothetical protein